MSSFRLVNASELALECIRKHDAPEDIAIARKILDGLVSQLQPGRLFQKPLFIHMMSFPGCGKTTIAQKIIESHNGRLFHLGFDKIMEAIPEYQEDLAKHGIEAAFSRWELPARIIGYELLEEAINSRISILFDNGGTSNDHVGLLLDTKRKSYHIVMVEAVTSVDSAVIRCANRPRSLSEDLVRSRAERMQHLSPEYRSRFPVIQIRNDADIADINIMEAIQYLSNPVISRYV